MSYVFESDVENFKGKVYFPEFYTLPQIAAFHEANDKTQAAGKKYKKGLYPVYVRNGLILPTLLSLVEKMEIEEQLAKPTIDTFRYTPAPNGDVFVAYMIIEITRVVMGQSRLPKG